MYLNDCLQSTCSICFYLFCDKRWAQGAYDIEANLRYSALRSLHDMQHWWHDKLWRSARLPAHSHKTHTHTHAHAVLALSLSTHTHLWFSTKNAFTLHARQSFAVACRCQWGRANFNCCSQQENIKQTSFDKQILSIIVHNSKNKKSKCCWCYRAANIELDENVSMEGAITALKRDTNRYVGNSVW